MTKSLVVGLLCAALVLGSQAQLIEVTDSSAPFGAGDEEGGISIVGSLNPDKPGTSIDELASQIFGEGNDDDDGGINIVGPVNPGQPGASIDEPFSTQAPEAKVTTVDPWQAFYDPDNKNIFGQTFPRPEDDNSNSGNQLSTIAPRNPHATPSAGGNIGFQEVTSPYVFPGVETTVAPTSHNYPSTSGYVTSPITSAPTTQKPTTTTKKHHGGLGGLGEGLGGIFGWGKHTTQKPQTEDKNKGHRGGILGGWKNAIESNKDAVHKAAESVKEAGEKVAQAGKDVLEAGLKIKGSLIPGLGGLLGGNKFKN